MLIPKQIVLPKQVPFAWMVTCAVGAMSLLIIIFLFPDTQQINLVEPMEVRAVMITRPPPPEPEEVEETTTEEATTEPEVAPEKVQFNLNVNVSSAARRTRNTAVTQDAGGGSAGSRQSMEVTASADLTSSSGGSQLLRGEMSVSRGPSGGRGGSRGGGGLDGTLGRLGSGSGTDSGLGDGAGPGSGLGGPAGQGETDSGTARTLALRELPEEQYERGLDVNGVCNWMENKPANLDPGVKQAMAGGTWADRFISSRSRVQISGRGQIEIQLMCDRSINELHVVLIEDEQAYYHVVRTIGGNANLFEFGRPVRRAQDSPISQLETNPKATSSPESRVFQTLFYSWWSQVAQ